jgi:CDP-diacylglycerol--serine O-phosphatidyltransferase
MPALTRTKDTADDMKKIAILPTLLTLGNAVCGFAAIACASKIGPDTAIYFTYSAWLIMAAMIFDLFDGYAARLSKSATDFGGQLDSLCDAISFGAAPAFLLLRLGLDWPEGSLLRQAMVVVAVLFMVCAVLRLARFNLENSPDPAAHKRFKGLPSPMAGGCIASLALLRGPLPDTLFHLEPALRGTVKVWAPLGALLVALLMVSRVPYPHLTKQVLRGRRHFSYLVRIVLVCAAAALLRELALVVLFWGYALGMLIRFAVLRALRASQRAAQTPAGLDDALPR